MEWALRAIGMYLALMVLLRVVGKRSMAQVTTFDFVLLLVISEATQQALLGEDFSVTTATIVIVTLLVLERSLDWLSWRSSRVRRWTESMPVLLVADGRPDQRALDEHHLDVDDIVTAGREQHGLAGLDEIRWAVLETSGGISVIPWRTVAVERPLGMSGGTAGP
jgi:uncharacterized membrane protein YcaP (DUF421 family)